MCVCVYRGEASVPHRFIRTLARVSVVVALALPSFLPSFLPSSGRSFFSLLTFSLLLASRFELFACRYTAEETCISRRVARRPFIHRWAWTTWTSLSLSLARLLNDACTVAACFQSVQRSPFMRGQTQWNRESFSFQFFNKLSYACCLRHCSRAAASVMVVVRYDDHMRVYIRGGELLRGIWNNIRRCTSESLFKYKKFYVY